MILYSKDYMKIKFESNDNWQTNNIINIHQVKIIIRLVFKKVRNCIYKFI